MQVTRLIFLVLLLGMVAADQPAASDGDRRNRERVRAQAIAARIAREWPLVGTGPVLTFVQQLGKRLAQAAGRAPYPWQFTVVRDHAVTAFAIGGGRIYVSDGTILGCQDEAELAAIVAHEMGHQLAGHFQTSAESDFHRRLLSLLGVGKGDRADVTIGSLTQELDPAKELEADRWSVRLLVGAGYDPQAALRVAQRVLAQPAKEREQHLDTTKRIAALTQLLAATPPGGRTDSPAFRRLRQQVGHESW